MAHLPSEGDLPRDESVLLTFFRLSDASRLSVVDADPEHRRRFEFPDDFVASEDHSKRVISDWTHQRERNGPFVFAVRAVVGGDLLGGCEIRLLDGGRANLSYFTLPQHRGGGVASRATGLACEIAFMSLGVTSIEIVTDPDNIPSRKVAARNGFQEIGVRNGQMLHTKNVGLPNNSFESDALKTTRASS
jgi:RimJ/RimL family protein N-acetyltransferase